MIEGDDVDEVLALGREMIALQSLRLASVYRLVCAARETVGEQHSERSVCEELRLAQRIDRGECVTVVELAVALHERYPELLACLNEGLLDQYRTQQACEVLRSLSREQAGTAVERIAARLRDTGRPYDWRSYVRRVADTVAPDAKQQRMTQRRSDRWACFDSGPDGAGMLLAQLPNEVLAEAGTRVEATARSLRAHGDERNLEQLRADMLTRLLLGDHGGESGGADARVSPARLVINVYVPLGAVLRLDDTDATIDGYGPIPAETARELLQDPNNVVRKVLTDPDTGTVTGLGRRRYRPGNRQRQFVGARDRHCRTPGCTKPIAEIDHIHEWQHGGTTDPTNLQGLCRLNHALKTLPGWNHQPGRRNGQLAVTTPTGRTYYDEPDPVPF